MKLFWFGERSFSSRGLNLLTATLAITLYMTLHRGIGLHWASVAGFSCLGIRVIRILFMLSGILPSSKVFLTTATTAGLLWHPKISGRKSAVCHQARGPCRLSCWSLLHFNFDDWTIKTGKLFSIKGRRAKGSFFQFQFLQLELIRTSPSSFLIPRREGGG